jgi:hypothetical protein
MRLYLDLLKKCLTRTIFPDSNLTMDGKILPYDPEARRLGHLWPTEALTMVGVERLNLLERVCLDVIQENVPGDFVECGIGRGGCSILMRGVLAAAGDKTRNVWLFDSFEGLPKPAVAEDAGDTLWQYDYFCVPVERVQENFRMFDLLDERVRFVKGWFRDTTPTAEVQKISVLRLDGDMYDSTMVALTSLYSRIQPGGYIVIDDYGALEPCRRAVTDYRTKHGIDAPIGTIDWTGVYWQVNATPKTLASRLFRRK